MSREHNAVLPVPNQGPSSLGKCKDKAAVSLTLQDRLSGYLLATVCNVQKQEALNYEFSRSLGCCSSRGHLLIKTFAKQHQYTSLSPTHARRLSLISLATYRDHGQPWTFRTQWPTIVVCSSEESSRPGISDNENSFYGYFRTISAECKGCNYPSDMVAHPFK